MLVELKTLRGDCAIYTGLFIANTPMGRSISIHTDQFYTTTTQEFLATNC